MVPIPLRRVARIPCSASRNSRGSPPFARSHAKLTASFGTSPPAPPVRSALPGSNHLRRLIPENHAPYVRTPFSTEAARCAITELRSQRHAKINNRVWDAYLSSAQSCVVDPSTAVVRAQAVFRAVDVNRNLKVSVSEMEAFLDTVERKGVKKESSAARMLVELAAEDGDHELDEEEFGQWLRLVTTAPDAVLDETEVASAEEEVLDSAPAAEKKAYEKVSSLRSRRASKLQRLAWKRFLDHYFHDRRDQGTTAASDDLFRTIDVNHDLRISVQELRDFLKSLGDDAGLKKGEFDEMQEEMEDGKKELSMEDFREWMDHIAESKVNWSLSAKLNL